MHPQTQRIDAPPPQDRTRTVDATPRTPFATGGSGSVPRLTWRRLLTVAAVADLVAILGIAAWFGDPEAAATGAGFAVGLALLRWRAGLLGRIALTVLFVDVLAWMALGAVTNVTGGEPVRAVLIPGTLTGISLTGLVAALVNLRRRPSTGDHAAGDHAAGDRPAGAGPVVAAGVGVVVVVVAVVAALVTPERTADAADVRLLSENVLFDRSTIELPAGEVTVALDNRDLFWHTFTVDELGVDLAVPVSGDRQVTFTAEPGTYAFYCRIPGHESRMVGTLVVR